MGGGREGGGRGGGGGWEGAGVLVVYFTLVLGIPAALQVLALGLLIAVAVFTRQALRLGAAGFDARKIG